MAQRDGCSRTAVGRNLSAARHRSASQVSLSEPESVCMSRTGERVEVHAMATSASRLDGDASSTGVCRSPSVAIAQRSTRTARYAASSRRPTRPLASPQGLASAAPRRPRTNSSMAPLAPWVALE